MSWDIKKWRKFTKYLIFKIPITLRSIKSNECDELIIDAFLYCSENGLDIEAEQDVKKALCKCFSKRQTEFIKLCPTRIQYRDSITTEWINKNRDKWHEINNRSRQRSRDLVDDAYCIKLLRGKYTKTQILANPNLITETRERIILKRMKRAA